MMPPPEHPEPSTTSDERQLILDARAQAEAAVDPAPMSFPGYTRVQEIHRGGQGVVFRAVQEATGRKVAIKVLREGPLAGASGRARFEREVRVLGQLRHPNIVAVHDSGVVGGWYHYVMDYIPGQALEAFVAHHRLKSRPILGLFARIGDAVNAAHLRGVIHRDLKPSNIRVDPDGEPHILDFGIAKLPMEAGEGDGSDHVATLTGQFVGSLPWSSPEQAEGRTDTLDVRSDVYSIGVMLYQMLAGCFPYPVEGSMHEVLEHVMRTVPGPPSAHRRGLDGEVDTIVLKCLSKERSRRYQSAGELARDIRNYLAGRPIEAKRDSTWYVMTKTLRRHWPAASAATLAIALIVVLAVFMTLQTSRLGSALESARTAEAEKQRALDDVAESLIVEQEASAARAQAASRLAAMLHSRDMERIVEAWSEGDGAAVRRRLDAIPQSRHDWLWRHYDWRSRRQVRRIDMGDQVPATAVSPDGRRLVIGTWQGTLEIHDLAGAAAPLVLEGAVADVRDVAFDPAGGTFAVAGSEGVAVFDTGSGERVAEMSAPTTGLEHVAIGQETVLAATADGRCFMWDGASGELVATLLCVHDEESAEVRGLSGIEAVELCGDGRRAVTGGAGLVKVWDVERGVAVRTLVLPERRPAVRAIALDSGASCVAASTSQVALSGASPWMPPDTQITSAPHIFLWDLSAETDEPRLVLKDAGADVLVFSPDGQRLLSGRRLDETIVIRDATSGQVLLEMLGVGAGAETLVESVRHAVFSAGTDGVVREWDAPPLARRVPIAADPPVLALSGRDGRLTAIRPGAAGGLVLDRDGRGGRLAVSAGAGFAQCAVIDPGGTWCASGWPDGRVLITALDSGSRLHEFIHQGGEVVCLATDVEGRVLVSGGAEGAVHRWDPVDGRHLGLVGDHGDAVSAVAVRRWFDGVGVASGGADGVVRIWSIEVAQRELVGHRAGISAVALDARSTRVASGDLDGAVWIWDTERREPVQRFSDAHAQGVEAMVFLDGGRVLASAGGDGVIRLWDAIYAEPMPALGRHEGAVVALAVDRESGALVSAGSDGLVRYWPVSGD